MALGCIDKPLAFLLFSNFAVIVAYVHLFTLFMMVPIFNAMVGIDSAVIEAVSRCRLMHSRRPKQCLYLPIEWITAQ
jgi:ABC-type spermidine/putrescine transport system permease subunit I